MKIINWKVTAVIFTVFAMIDAVLISLCFLPWTGFYRTLAVGIAAVFNLPGSALAIIFFRPIVSQDVTGYGLLAAAVCSGIISVVIWSLIGGFIFRHKNVA